MKPISGVGAVLALAGGASSRSMVLPDGSAGNAIRCDGAAPSMSDCAIKAGELCPRGYDVVGADGQAAPVTFASGGVFSAGAMVTRSMVARCKA